MRESFQDLILHLVLTGIFVLCATGLWVLTRRLVRRFRALGRFARVLVVVQVTVAALLAQKPGGDDDGNGDGDDPPRQQQSAPPRRSPVQGDEDDNPPPVATNLFFSAIEKGTNGVALAIDWTPAGVRQGENLPQISQRSQIERWV